MIDTSKVLDVLLPIDRKGIEFIVWDAAKASSPKPRAPEDRAIRQGGMGPDRTSRRKPPKNSARGRIKRIHLVPGVSERPDIYNPICYDWGRIINPALRVRRLPQDFACGGIERHP